MVDPEQEGVIKYSCSLASRELPAAVLDNIAGLNRWRQIFYERNLIGEDPERYGGFGFGNLSIRVSTEHGVFVITGTQTSGLPILDPDRHYTVVNEYDIDANTLSAYGPLEPSSEALTHAALYHLNPAINAVFHVHQPTIWRAVERLVIPITHPEVSYGTPEMAKEMWRLLEDTDAKTKRIISLAGHEDGIIVFGATEEEAGSTMLDYLARAME